MWKFFRSLTIRTAEATHRGVRAAKDQLSDGLRRRHGTRYHRIAIARADSVDRPLPPLHWMPCHSATRDRFKASFACHRGHVLTLRAHQISADGCVAPSVVCPHGCSFHAYIRLRDWTFGHLP
jgi:hypothetical protein